jgi:hypothetical protein
MGYSKKRIDRHGKPRYTACYLDAHGSLRSASTAAAIWALTWGGV